MPEVRHLHAGAGAADLLLQLPAWRLPALHRPWLATGDRPGPGRRSDSDAQRGRAPALDLRRRLLRAARAGDRREVRDRPRHALGGPVRGAPGPVPVRGAGRARLRLLPQPHGPPALLHGADRGHRPEPGAALPRDRLGVVARADRGVHVGCALPGVRRRAVAAGEPRRAGRRNRHPRVHPQVGPRRDRLPRWAGAEQLRAPDRGARS